MSATEISLLAFLLFAVVGLLLYFISPKRFKWVSLVIVSIAGAFILTAYWIIFIFVIVTMAYISGRLIDRNNNKYDEEKALLEKEEKKKLKKKYNKKNKIIVFSFVGVILLTLALLKYFNLPLGTLNNWFDKYYFLDILFPILGISYYALIAISYVVDVYRGKAIAQHNYLKLYLFIGYFPSLVEGPFSRYDELSPQLYKDTNPEYQDIVEGFHLIVWGAFKKIFIADRAYMFVETVYGDWGTFNGYIGLLSIVIYVFELYADFSGYIDIARGVSRLFGIKLTKNFDSPLMSRTVGEFWRRWHISLGSWLRDYIFYPIALTRPMMKLSKKLHGNVKEWMEKIIINAIPLFFVWLCCGIWHGAGIKFVIYGMYFFIVIILEMLLEPLNKMVFKKDNWFLHLLSIIRTFIFVTIGLALFKAPSFHFFWCFLKHIPSTNKLGHFIGIGTLNIYDFRLLVFGIIIIILVDIIHYFRPQLKLSNFNIVIRYIILIIMILVIVFFGAYGPDYSDVAPMYALY